MNTLFGGEPMKAISLWQPWASLVAAGVKRHETRHWNTDYRGPIAICAAKTVDLAGAPYDLCRDVLGVHWAKTVPTGAVVAIATLTRCCQTSHMTEALTRADSAAGNFTPGRYAWRLDDVRPLMKPLPVVGRQGLFNWTPPVDLEGILHTPLDHEAACRYAGWF